MDRDREDLNKSVPNPELKQTYRIDWCSQVNCVRKRDVQSSGGACQGPRARSSASATLSKSSSSKGRRDQLDIDGESFARTSQGEREARKTGEIEPLAEAHGVAIVVRITGPIIAGTVEKCGGRGDGESRRMGTSRIWRRISARTASRSAQAARNASSVTGDSAAVISRYSRSIGLSSDSCPLVLWRSRWPMTWPKKNHQRFSAMSNLSRRKWFNAEALGGKKLCGAADCFDEFLVWRSRARGCVEFRCEDPFRFLLESPCSRNRCRKWIAHQGPPLLQIKLEGRRRCGPSDPPRPARKMRRRVEGNGRWQECGPE